MPHTGPAYVELEKLIPKFKELNPKSMLYVGWRHDCNPWWHAKFAKGLGIEKLAIIEINDGNYRGFLSTKKDYDCDAYHGDVREIENYISKSQFDIIFWDHGPEHVSWDDLKKVTPKLLDFSGKLLLYCCPLGDWPQGAEGGNPHEEHKNSVTTDQFKDLGLEYVTMGEPGVSTLGEIIGYKVKS